MSKPESEKLCWVIGCDAPRDGGRPYIGTTVGGNYFRLYPQDDFADAVRRLKFMEAISGQLNRDEILAQGIAMDESESLAQFLDTAADKVSSIALKFAFRESAKLIRANSVQEGTTDSAVGRSELRAVVADIRAHCNPQNPESDDEVSAAYALSWADRIDYALRGMSHDDAAIRAQVGGDDSLPAALVPHADEWYRLCERRFAVDRITISGPLAEAIVEAMGATPAPALDANVEAVRTKLMERSRVGLAKYGVTTERGDLSLADWLRHMQEELLDGAVYIEAAIAHARSAGGEG